MKIHCENCPCVYEEGEGGYTSEMWPICPDCGTPVNPADLEADDADDASEDED